MLLWGAPELILTPGTLLSGEDVPGPASDLEAAFLLRPQTVLSAEEVPGPKPLPDPLLQTSISPMPVKYVEQVPGPWIEPSPPPESIADKYAFTVTGYPNSQGIQCQPQMNSDGSGSFTTVDDPPDLEEIVGFNIGGRRVFTGRVVGRTKRVYAEGEEADQTTDVECLGLISEWDQAIILPDFGARDVGQLRRPAQDIRFFDWTMNGIGTKGSDTIEPTVQLGRSVSIDVVQSAIDEHFPLPDQWPDPTARWMWVTDPSKTQQPRGWCYFRVPTPSIRMSTTRIQFWAVAYDYAEIWIDGVPLLECKKPGVAERIELPTTAFASHLVTIRAHNGGGKAGVLFTMIPVDEDTGLYREAEHAHTNVSIMNSRSNWRTLAYPSQSLRLTPGVILQHLRREARWRRVKYIPDWRFTFNHYFDSAGVPWPTDKPPISVTVGSTYLDFLRQLAEDRIDFAVAPAGRVLHAWNKGTGHQDSVDQPWTAGVDLRSRTQELRYT